MSNWREGILGDILQFQRGFDITKKEQIEGDVPVVSSSGVTSYHNLSRVKGPGVITGRKGSLGKVHFVDVEYWPHDTTLWVRDFKGNDPKFLYYFLQLMHLENYDVGASNPTLNRNHIHKVKLRYPLPKIQKKIAAILSTYDDLIENNNRRIDLLEQAAEEIYREWFVRMRFPGWESAKFEKGVPVGWEVIKLEEVCELIKRGISPKYDDESDALVINQRCIRDGNIDISVARKHNTRVPGEKYVRYGDVLINSTGVGTLGRISIVEFQKKNITFDSHVTICRYKESKIDNFYLAHAIKRLQSYFEYMATGATGQVELNRGLISKTKIFFPTPQLQEKFGVVANNIGRQKYHLIQATSLLRASRDRLLSRLISGKLPVDDLDICFPPSMIAAKEPTHA